MPLARLFGNSMFPAKPTPPAAPAIPEAYYGRTPAYVPFDRSIPAADLAAINDQQKRRNLAFEEWISAVADVCTILGNPLAYKLEQSLGNLSFTVQPNYARTKLTPISPSWEGAFTHYHMDIWPPAQAALVAISNAKDSLLFFDPGVSLP